MSPRSGIMLELKKSLPYLRRTYHVRRLGVFGSYARNTATRESDLDLLVEFSEPIGLRFVALSAYLEKRLGRKVDLLTPEGIDSIRQESIANSIRWDAVYV